MERKKKNRGIYFVLFFISVAGFIWAVESHFEYITMILPFGGTFFVKALDII